MIVDVDHFSDRGSVRKCTSGVPLKWFVDVLVCPDCAMLVAWALVIYLVRWVGAQFVCLLGRSPVF